MVEEAAGTRMYETKKQAAQKTIEKKDAKLKELSDVSKNWKVCLYCYNYIILYYCFDVCVYLNDKVYKI